MSTGCVRRPDRAYRPGASGAPAAATASLARTHDRAGRRFAPLRLAVHRRFPPLRLAVHRRFPPLRLAVHVR